MGYHPLNLALRFALEVIALIALGAWGWTQFEGGPRIGLAIGLPLIAAGIWGTFRTPGDRSSSGGAPVAVPGFLRLLIELTLFGIAAWAVSDVGRSGLALALTAIVILHYALSYDRLAWLLRSGSGTAP